MPTKSGNSKKSLQEEVESLPDQPLTLHELNKQLVELDSADTRLSLMRKQLSRAHKKLEQQETGAEIALAAYKDCYSEPLDIRVIRPKKQTGKKDIEEAVLHLTDIHIGKETDTYNAEVAADRMYQVVGKVARLVEMRRANAKIHKLTILWGGDFAEGEGEIFPGQEHEIDIDLIEQIVKFGPEVICNVTLGLLELFPEIHIVGVPGNHGRPRYARRAKRNNNDSILYEITRKNLQLSAPKEFKRLSWDLPFDRSKGEGWRGVGRICDKWGYLLVHGDQIKGHSGYPWYGCGKRVGKWSTMHDMPAFQFLFMGHYHTSATFDINEVMVVSTGSPEDSNAHASESHSASGLPKQRLMFFNQDTGMIANNELYLD